MVKSSTNKKLCLGAHLRGLILFFATGAGVGYFPRFPGTVGTLAAVPLSFVLNRIAAASFGVALLTLATFILLAIWVSEKGEEIFREKDSPKIVIDEITGFLLANFLSPPAFKPVVAAFLLFRFFDIMKIPPASWVEQLPGGVGVVLDDLVSAIYTFLLLRLLFFLSLL